MKVKIKYFKGNLSGYLTLGKHYDVIESDVGILSGLHCILNDYGDHSLIYLKDCSHLNGGEWEIVDEQ